MDRVHGMTVVDLNDQDDELLLPSDHRYSGAQTPSASAKHRTEELLMYQLDSCMLFSPKDHLGQ
jgi:hypothetical protein